MASSPLENRNSLASFEKCVLCGCSKEQYEELKKRVEDSKKRITMMETDYLQSTLRAENDLAKCKEELRVLRERHKRLEDSHSALQKTNQTIEEKLLQVAATNEKEKQFLGKEMMTLTSRLVDVRCKLNQKEDENARLKKDCELSVQLLQCAPASNYLTHKVSMLPHDLQYRVHKVMAEEFTTPSPDTVEPLLYTPNEDAPNLAGRVYDRVSTAVIARAMKMREDDTQNNKCVPATIIKKDLSNIGTQTIQPYQGSLSAKTRRNSVTNDRGIQADLGKESLENCIEGTETGNDSDIPSNINGKRLSPSHRSPQRTTPSSPPPNLLDDIVDLIDFSQPSSQSNDVSVNESVISNSHPSQTSRNSSRRSSTESNSDSIVGGINSRRSSSSSNHSSSSSQNRKSDSHNVLNTNKQRIGRHSSREMEYGPDLIQASPPPTTSHYQPFKFHTRGGGPGQIGKARGPMKPGMFAAHHQNHPGGVGGVRMHYNTPPASPGHPNIVNKISTQTDV